MKRVKIFLFILTVGIAVISCKKDKDNIPQISGKYEATYAKVEVIMGGSTVTKEYKTVDELKEKKLYVVIEFKSDGKLYVDNKLTGTWVQNDNTITITETEENGTTKTIIGKVEGDNKLTVSINKTEKQDGQEMKIKIDYEFTKM
jgi:hypothetical protein